MFAFAFPRGTRCVRASKFGGEKRVLTEQWCERVLANLWRASTSHLSFCPPGHLDRVAHGVTAEDILHACGQRQIVTTDVTNPHISLTQALKRRNLATFRNMAQQKMQQVGTVNARLSFRSCLGRRQLGDHTASLVWSKLQQKCFRTFIVMNILRLCCAGARSAAQTRPRVAAHAPAAPRRRAPDAHPGAAHQHQRRGRARCLLRHRVTHQ